MTGHVTLTIRPDGRAEVRSPFSAKETIKESVPPWLREWDKPRRCWIIAGSEAAELAQALRLAGFQVSVTDTRPKAAPPPPPRRSWVEQAFDACPAALRPKLRRALMGIFHPDIGGSPELAQEINRVADYHDTHRRSA